MENCSLPGMAAAGFPLLLSMALKASVTVIKEGLKTPTAVEPAGGTIWVAERGAGKAVSIPMPK
jgi:hypothetical protein